MTKGSFEVAPSPQISFNISQLKEDLEQKITTWQREVDLKLMKSYGAPM